MDYGAMDTVTLHLHSIAAADPGTIVVVQDAAGTSAEVRVEKKNKKRFDR